MPVPTSVCLSLTGQVVSSQEERLAFRSSRERLDSGGRPREAGGRGPGKEEQLALLGAGQVLFPVLSHKPGSGDNCGCVP